MKILRVLSLFGLLSLLSGCAITAPDYPYYTGTFYRDHFPDAYIVPAYSRHTVMGPLYNNEGNYGTGCCGN